MFKLKKEEQNMKLIIAIVSDEDGNPVLRALNEEGFGVTKLATTGGVINSGNTTLLLGVEDDQVDRVKDIVASFSKTLKSL